MNTSSLFTENDNFVLLTHRNPDGDTLGSAAGLCSALRDAGKTAYLLVNAQTTPLYAEYVSKYFRSFSSSELLRTHVSTHQPKLAIVSLDTSSFELLQENFPRNGRHRIRLAIDHHASHSPFAKRIFNQPHKAACGEIVLDFIKEAGLPLSAETAKLLYIAIATDTGCLRYKNTNADTLRAVSELYDAGAPCGELNRILFTEKSLGRLRLESAITSNLQMLMGGKLAVATITPKLIEQCGADEDDLNDIANVVNQIRGLEMGITIREMPVTEFEQPSAKPGLEHSVNGKPAAQLKCKISVRTVNTGNAAAVCARLGGGGHAMAAGVTLYCPIEEARSHILDAVSAELAAQQLTVDN